MAEISKSRSEHITGVTASDPEQWIDTDLEKEESLY
jgi:hypothetical protein